METKFLQIYTEATPNPDSMKFVVNKILLPQQSIDFENEESAAHAPLAKELFGFPFVKRVFIANNFVTITKDAQAEWVDTAPSLKAFIKDYVEADKPVVQKEAFNQQKEAPANEEEGELEKKIKDALDTYVKPAVEMDGGAIKYKSFNDGVVTLVLQGSCSGCPSATVTLKAGIEGLLKRMVPQVTEVVAEEE